MPDPIINPAEAYEKILTCNLQRAIDFLKFAEAKNAALLALCSAWVVAIVNLECSGKTIPRYLDKTLPVVLVLSLSAGLLAMISFLPRLSLPAFLGGKRAGPHSKNLLYYGDICSLPIKTLKEDFHARYHPDDNGYKTDYIHDLVVQISVNSEIALRKMLLFRWGMGLILLAGFALLVPVIGEAFHSLAGRW